MRPTKRMLELLKIGVQDAKKHRPPSEGSMIGLHAEDNRWGRYQVEFVHDRRQETKPFVVVYGFKSWNYSFTHVTKRVLIGLVIALLTLPAMGWAEDCSKYLEGGWTTELPGRNRAWGFCISKQLEQIAAEMKNG